MDDADILAINKNFSFSGNLSGPALAVAVSAEIVLALVANLFVLLFTLSHINILKQSSIIFLTNFVFANLIMAILYLPTIVVTAITKEWVFGITLEQKAGSCKFVAFIFTLTLFLTTFTLTAISVDRFLFIVKPMFHKRAMTSRKAVVISIASWILACLLSILPLFDIGEYSFSRSNATCVPAWYSQRSFTILIFVGVAFFGVMACVVTILVTSIWTFCFTHKFISNRQQSYGDTSNTKHVYNSRIMKICGIFGTMLIVTAITYAPGGISCVVGFVIGFEKLPDEVFASITFAFYTITISNPIIQSYFRRELNDFLVVHSRSFVKRCSRLFSIKQSSSFSLNNGGIGSDVVISNKKLTNDIV